MDLGEYLPESAIRARAHPADWREAIRLAGDGLVASEVTTAEYTDEMLAAIDRYGPYIVIAPGIALAHSRPSPAVRRSGLSWVGLAEPVEFGHETNDPVSLVVGLAAVDHDSHLGMMSALAETIADPSLVRTALEASTPAEVRALLSVTGSAGGTPPAGKETP